MRTPPSPLAHAAHLRSLGRASGLRVRAALAAACLTAAILLAGVSPAAAQGNIKTYKRNGLEYYAAGRFANAAEALTVYRRYVPDDDEVWLPLAMSHYELNELDEARTLLDGLLRAKGTAPAEAYLTLGRIDHHQARFPQAAAAYKLFLRAAGEKHPLHASIVDEVRRVGNALRMGPSTGALAAYAENLGRGINSPGDDVHPVLSPNYADRLYFSSVREGNTGGRRDPEGLPSPEGKLSSDMFAVQFDNGRWGTAQRMSALLNGPDDDEVLDFARGGQVLVYWKGPSRFSGDIHVDTFKARAEDRGLYSPVWRDHPMQPRLGDKDPILFNDTTLLFASGREGGFGGMDLYVSVRRAGRWTTPENLGPEVNTAYDERAPFLAADGRTLFYSSNRADMSVGGFDVFRVGFDDRTLSWSRPENAGLSINSAGDELHFRLSASGLEGYFDSDLRATSQGGADVYVAYFKDRQREQGIASTPATFFQVQETARLSSLVDQPAYRIGEDGAAVPVPAAPERPKIPVAVRLSPLPYGRDDNVVTPANLQRATPAIQFLEQYPGSRVVVTAHSDESDPERFRLYFGIKRAERFAAYLTERGVAPDRIQLVSTGASYPVAANDYNGQENPQGQKLNRRLELQLVPGPDYLLTREYDDPKVPSFLALDAFERYRDLQVGSAFRVEVARLGQMYDDEAFLRQRAPVITSDAGSGLYRYEVGTFASYRSARAFAAELRSKGFGDARVVAYYDGLRLSPRDLARFALADPEIDAMLAAQPPAE